MSALSVPARGLAAIMTVVALGATTAGATGGAAAAPHAFRDAKDLRYSGAGNRNLRTVRVVADSVVRWTATGGSFSLRDASGKLNVSGRTTRGQSFVVRRTYRRVRVRAKGRWTLSIAPLPMPSVNG